jgi:hypothetical protein
MRLTIYVCFELDEPVAVYLYEEEAQALCDLSYVYYYDRYVVELR